MAGETSQTVARALELLKLFNRNEPELHAGEIAARLGLNRTIVGRLLRTLEEAGFLERRSNQPRFRIGRSAFAIGALYLTANPLFVRATQALETLAEQTGFTAYLGTLDGADTVILAHREGRHPIRFIWGIGDRLPVTTTALGKAILAALPPERLDQVLGTGPLAGLTPSSLRSRHELDQQLAVARGQGWVAAVDESYPGITAVGAAILDARHSPVAGLSLSFLTYPPDPTRTLSCAELVLGAARDLSHHAAEYSQYSQRLMRREPLDGAAAGERRPAIG